MSFRIALLCITATITLVFLTSVVVMKKIEAVTYSAKEADLCTTAEEYASFFSKQGIDSKFNLPQGFSWNTRRVLITNSDLSILFDSSEIDNLTGKSAFLEPIINALRGEDYFSFDYSNDGFQTSVGSPIVIDGKVAGAVCIYETDISLHGIYSALRSALFISACIAILLVLVLIFLISFLIIRRMSSLTKTVNKTGDDSETTEKIPIVYNDEIAPMIHEFNNIYERLNYVQQMRQAFVSDASHELRTPLAAIRLLCESITISENVDIETIQEFMQDIILEVDRMSHTAEKLLILSRLDNSQKKSYAPISLSEIVHKMITAFEPIAADKDVTIESYIDDDCSIIGDMEGANQIIGNLIDNAIKYNNVGGKLRIYLFSKNKTCTFITDDTGIGIAPEFREHIFERFYRVDKSRKHDGRGGSGLGLSIVKRNVEFFGGTIKVSDSVNGGTRFTVVFPNLSGGEGI